MCGTQACVCTQICAHMCTLIYGPKFDVRCLPPLLPSIFTKTEFMAEPKWFFLWLFQLARLPLGSVFAS